jgi:hypothetical protein
MATLIHDVTELQAMSGDLTADYELANDIDASATSTWNAGAGFVPVGNSGPPFTGAFDGKLYTISNLYINRPATNYIGLFGYTYGSIISNLYLIDSNITGQQHTASCIGYADDTAINTVIASGTITGGQWLGGIVGELYDGDIIDCTANVTVTSPGGGNYCGGLAGEVGRLVDPTFSHSILRSTATGDVSSPTGDGIGGLIGDITDYNIQQSLATGNVTGDDWIGGLIGYCSCALSNSYARGNIVGDNYVGGLLGQQVGLTIDNSFSTGQVVGNANVGGLCGKNNGTVTACFWDTQTSGTVVSNGGTGKTTAQMNLIATFSAWDIALSSANLNDGYPFLGWEVEDTTHTWLIYGLSPRRTLAVEDKITLETIRNVEMVAMGRFRVDKEGNAVYRSRYARNA